MERTVWITALALAVTASVSCKDSNPNYIAFDAQAPTTDAKGDVPPRSDGAAGDAATDHGSPSSDATATDVGTDHPADAPASDAPTETALARDTASDDGAGPEAGDATANDGGDGQ